MDGVVETRQGRVMTPWATKVELLSMHYMVKYWGCGDQGRAHHDSLGHTQLIHRSCGCQHAGISDQLDQTWLCPSTNRWAYTNRLAGTNQLVLKKNDALPKSLTQKYSQPKNGNKNGT